VLWFLPSLPPLSALWAGNGPAQLGTRSLSGDETRARMRAGTELGLGIKDGMERGPLELYLPYLNAILVVLLALTGFVGQQRVKEGQGEGMWFALLPGVVYGVVVVAKGIMGSVDVGELEGLRYGYKGA
jgi:hypothetical protein